MKMMPGEFQVSSSDHGTLSLTNMRIRSMVDGNGTSILLENIQSIRVQFKNYWIFIVLGVMCFIGSLAGMEGEYSILLTGIASGIIFILIYFYTRRHSMLISSSGENIDLLIKGQSTQKVIDMIDLIEDTVCKRKMQLNP